jgi:hypothetical protein
VHIRPGIFILIFSLLCSPALAKKKNTPLPDPPHAAATTATDTNYVSALSAANRFLQAWQTQDHEAGLLLLTDSAKHVTSEDQLEKMLSPGTSTPRGYQIARGKKLSTGRYAFPITLLEVTSERKPLRTRNSQIVVVHTGKDDWAIDKLP